MRKVALGATLIATVGLAIRRHLLSAPDATAQARIADLRTILAAMDRSQKSGQAKVREIHEHSGYADWASTYDDEGDAMFEYEQPAMHSLLDGLPVGRALDAACGTGRYLAYLSGLGHRVSGFDRCAEMLAIARTKVPGAELRLASFDAIPWDDGTFDAAVCGLALDHVPALAGPIGELARVVRHGARVVISDMHPVNKLLGQQAIYDSKNGTLGLIPSHVHLHGEYLRAFADAGLCVRQCLETVVQPGDSLLASPTNRMFSEAAAMAYLGLPMNVIWDLERL